MAVNKVVVNTENGEQVLVDLTSDTVRPEALAEGVVAHGASGERIVGTIPAKTGNDLTVSGATVNVPAGHYASAISKSVATAAQGTPSISVDSAGKITASVTQSAGYVSAGTKKATKQLPTQAAQTIMPGAVDQAIYSGTYLTGTQIIKGDTNLAPSNIKAGVSIFGVTGVLETGGTTGIPLVVRNNTDTVVGVGACVIEPGTEISVSVNGEWSTRVVFALMYMSECKIRYTGTYFDENEWSLIEVDFEEELYSESESEFFFHYMIDTVSWYFRNGSVIEISPL